MSLYDPMIGEGAGWYPIPKLTPEQQKAFEFHRSDAEDRLRAGCIPTYCSCWEGSPCDDALKGQLHMTVAPGEIS